MKKLLFAVFVLVVLVGGATLLIGTGDKEISMNEKIINAIKKQSINEPQYFMEEITAMVSKNNHEQKYGQFSEEMCENLGNQISKNGCWTGLAVMKNKMEYCDNIVGDKVECVNWVNKLRG